MIYRTSLPDWFKELEDTPFLKRLQGISMDCGLSYTNAKLPGGKPFNTLSFYTRFTHSVGVANIIYDFTGSEVQALSGLFHDCSTPAFSHTVDFLHEDYLVQESTELDTVRLLKQSKECMSLLTQHGISLDEVKDYHRYPIADNDSPKLSSDRLEYTLTNGIRYGYLTESMAQTIYDSLTVGVNESGETELVCTSQEAGIALARASLACGKVYSSDIDRYAMEYLSKLLNQAIQKGILSEADLNSTEEAVIHKLKTSSLASLWRHFTSLYDVEATDTKKDLETFKIEAKRRYIDPYVAPMGRVSKWNPSVQEEIEAHRKADYNVYLKGKFKV